MGYLEYQIDEMLTFLKREEERFNIAFANGPEGTLHRAKINGVPRYIHCIPETKENNAASGSNGSGSNGSKSNGPGSNKLYRRKVISHDPELIGSLASKEYARIALRQINRNMHYVELMKRYISEPKCEEIINSMKSAYRSLPKRCFDQEHEAPCNWQRQRIWASEPYEMSEYKPEGRNKSTSRGLHVRSKSEVLLIEKLYEYEIPFRYEQIIRVGQYELAPDFTFMDRNGDEFYLEYCGMMDDENYVSNFIWKRGVYESIGICRWKNIIYIFERNNEIRLDLIDHIIRTEIMPRL